MYKLDSATSWPTSNNTVSVGSALTFTITGLTTNTAYDVQVWAVNQFGEGPTDTYTISTSAVPDCPTNVNVTLDSTATEVDVTWTAAVDHNNTITSYTVYFLQSDGTTYSPVSGICTGTYTSTQACNGVSISTLMAATGNSIGTAIQVKVTATNSDGTSPLASCTASTPYTLNSEQQPVYASAPTTSVLNLAATPVSDSTITVSWTNLTLAQMGYSDITEYTILYYIYSDASSPTS